MGLKTAVETSFTHTHRNTSYTIYKSLKQHQIGLSYLSLCSDTHLRNTSPTDMRGGRVITGLEGINGRMERQEIRKGKRMNVHARWLRCGLFFFVSFCSVILRDREQGWRGWQTDERTKDRWSFRCRWQHLCCFSPWWSLRRRWGRSLPLRSASSPSSSRRLCPPRWCTTPAMEKKNWFVVRSLSGLLKSIAQNRGLPLTTAKPKYTFYGVVFCL